MIPHKSRMYRIILDLSYRLRLPPEEVMQLVNKLTTETAPRGTIKQLGHLLLRIIHVFAEADEDAKVFMAKWDKDGFWKLDCKEELVIPTTLQMDWIESPQ